MRYLITGGAGFIGSHLSEALLAAGHQVTAIDDLSTGRMQNVQPLTQDASFQLVVETITNATVMDRLVSECDLIVHLAAAVGVELIVRSPVHTIETNVLGTETVLRTARRYRKKTLIASTSEIYGKLNNVPFSEDDDSLIGATTHHRWAYATSKALDEFLALAYHKEMDLPVVVFRLFNTIGPRQRGRYGMVVPRFARQALSGADITVYGDGQQSRCFCDVRDVVPAIMELAAEPQAEGRVFNVGAQVEIAILDLAHKVKEMTGSQSAIILVPYEQATEQGFEDMHRRVPDIGRIHKLLGWEPRIPLERSIADIILQLKQEGPGDPISERPVSERVVVG
ncbi:MAG: GDP-mannose 4,6-dehydratase [Anaerolineales bacterium]|jgi:UDP-glucose 4-epimerase|nr:GDP-mannose 4,6-dehydratase [Anaerolineales bacterium]HJN41636.1 GDP-mannose 4,6-dehydratase [Anaerolineales bacterium]|tara:strand:+ start:2160 stop:3176 length:1017 start_codon:yes stop_codon:yes gene_type:complete